MKGVDVPYTEEMKNFIRDNQKGISRRELLACFVERFGSRVGRHEITEDNIKGFCSRNGLKNGRTGYWGKENPGKIWKKGECGKGCEKTWFKKGNIPKQHRPVGSMRTDRDGYLVVKVEEPNKWRLMHRVVWEEHNGPVPKGSIIRFHDGNPKNCAIENLYMVTRAQNAILNNNYKKVMGISEELDTLAVATATLNLEINKAGKRRKKHVHTGRGKGTVRNDTERSKAGNHKTDQ